MKGIKRFLLVIISIILLSGCVKNTITTKINKDKSMNLEIEILTKDEYKNTLSSIINSNSLENRGFKVITTNKNDYSGFKITRKFNNIDELCNASKDPVDITNILEKDFNYNSLFTKKSSFFKDTYTANFTFSSEKIQSKYLNAISTDDNSEEVELKYTLVIPTKALNNDADEVSTDKKYLTWKLSSKEDSKINYTFDIINMMHIYMIGGGALLLIVLLIVIIIIAKKKKASKATLIYKEYDPSIEGQLNKNEVIKGEATKVDAPQAVEAQAPQVVAQPVAPTEPVAPVQPATPVQPTAPAQPEVVVDAQAGTIIVNTPAPVQAETPAVEPTNSVPETPVEEVPQVATVEDNMEMKSLPSLEFDVPEEAQVQHQEIEEENFEVKPTSYDFNRRPDFVKSYEPNKFVDENDTKEEEVIIDEPKSVTDNLDVPQFVEPGTASEAPAPVEPSTEVPQPVSNNTFIVPTQEVNTEVPAPPSTPQLDVPNGVALSDMNEPK